MSDAAERYAQKRAEVKQAEHQIEIAVAQLSHAAEQMAGNPPRGWRNVYVLNGPAVSAQPHNWGRSPLADEWPCREEVEQLLTEYWSLVAQMDEAYKRVPEPLRSSMQPPHPSRRISQRV
jgi:hypothetical protein